MNFAVAPGMGDLLGRKKVSVSADVFLNLMRVSFFISISAAVVIVLFNRHFVTLWVGTENFGGMRLTIVFALTLVYIVMFQTSSIVVTSVLELKSLALSSWLEGLLNLSLSLVLIGKWGAVGVAVATLIAGLLTSGWFVPYRACRILEIDLATLIKQVIVRVVLFVCSISGIVLIPRLFPACWRPSILGQFVILVLCLAASGLILLLPRQEIWKAVRRSLGKA